MEEREIIKAIMHGNTSAYRKLILEYIPLVSRTSYRIMCDRADSEAVTKDVMLTVWRDPLSYITDRPLYQELLKRTCHMCRRRLMLRRLHALFFIHPEIYVMSSPVVPSADEFVARQAWEVFCRASRNCSDRQKIVYTLCELEEIPLSEAAAITSFIDFTIDDALQQARIHVKEELDRYGRINDYDLYVQFLRKVKDQLTDMYRLQRSIIQELFS